jgi:monothiol glutaredoxin
MDVMDRIKQAVEENAVMIFMKGEPKMPMCGFSSQAAQALMTCGKEFGYCNVIADQEVMANLPRFADWPTFPQIYIGGELIGGADITVELSQNGELQKMVDAASAAKA